MKVTYNSKTLLQKLKEKQPTWFSLKNKRFFNDIAYYGSYGGKTGDPFLLRKTNAWTDMFGQEAKTHYRINKVSYDYEICGLVDDIFENLDQVKNWLKEN